MDKLKVAVLFGGCAEEHPVSIKSARELARCLDREKYEPYYIYIDRAGRWRLVEGPDGDLTHGEAAILSPDRGTHGFVLARGVLRVDVVFPMLHGRCGEDGAMQGLLELAGIPYVGCGVAASALGMDKALTHLAARAAGVATPRFWLADERLEAEKLPYPLFVKPARSGSSFGVGKVLEPGALAAAVAAARVYDDKVLLEEAVVGREVGCAVLGEGASLTVGCVDMIELSGGFFRIHQEAKPESGSENATIRVPAPLDEALTERVRETARTVYRALGCEGLARVDMFLKDDGAVVLNEVNTMPGFTAYSRYPRMMEAAGISRKRLVDELLTRAIARRGFLPLDERVAPGLRVEAKYAGRDNFTGEVVDGYRGNRLFATREMAAGLREAARCAAREGLSLLIWDAYRPQRAVDCFLRWADAPEDGRTKAKHYPRIERARMVAEGYVARRSAHTRGSAVDLTLCDLQSGAPLKMGGEFDYMDEISHHGAAGISDLARENRRKLRGIMEQCGFIAFESEWWHYQLAREPYPDTYFDFCL